MKRLISILLLTIITKLAFTQMLCPDIMQFGLTASVEYTGSGHGTNMTVNMVALNDYKSLELGAVINEDGSRVKGADLKYKRFFGRYNHYYGNTLIKPYVYYNCLYQNAYTFQPIVVKTANETIILPDEIGGFTSTLEHYVGTGVMLRFLNNVYMDANLGVGAYFGSLDKFEAPNKVGFHDVNHGYTANFKIGIGYIL
jgi:hypothetical protein